MWLLKSIKIWWLTDNRWIIRHWKRARPHPLNSPSNKIKTIEDIRNKNDWFWRSVDAKQTPSNAFKAFSVLRHFMVPRTFRGEGTILKIESNAKSSILVQRNKPGTRYLLFWTYLFTIFYTGLKILLDAKIVGQFSLSKTIISRSTNIYCTS